MCEIEYLKATPQLSGTSLLHLAIAFCHAVGARNQFLDDASQMRRGTIRSGEELGIYQRGWTWYMRNGFMPMYREILRDQPLPWRSLSAMRSAEEMQRAVAPHLERWCRGANEAEGVLMRGPAKVVHEEADAFPEPGPAVQEALEAEHYIRVEVLAHKLKDLLYEAG